MMRTLAQTGNGWMTFKDKCNRASNQTAQGRQRHPPVEPVHRDPRSHLATKRPRCATWARSTSRQHLRRGRRCFDFDKLAETVRLAVRQLDRVIDLNFYPIETARRGNLRWRPVGLGVMGLQDVFFKLRLPFDSEAARALSTQDRRDDLLPRAGDLVRTGRGTRPRIRRSPTRARPTASCSSMPGASRRTTRERWDALRERITRARPAQLAADRDRADRDHRLDRRLLRMRRAADQQPVQARDAVGRLPAGQPLSGRRAEEARPVDAGDARRDQAGRRLDPGHRADSGSAARRSTAPPGKCRCAR